MVKLLRYGLSLRDIHERLVAGTIAAVGIVAITLMCVRR